LVGYNLAKQLARRPDEIHLTVYGFQRFHNLPNHRTDYPSNVFEYDAFANENPKAHGFGIDQVKDFVTMNKPDICIVYNDVSVLSGVISKLIEVPNRKFKILTYLDQVYLTQKRHFVNFLNEHSDAIMCFTPFWEANAAKIGFTRPSCFLRHGFCRDSHYPIPKLLARRYFGLSKDDFIILNLNRNQPRKRYDTCLQAFALALSRLPADNNLKMVISTAPTGGWDLFEVYSRELSKYGIDMERGMRHLIMMQQPQNQTDDDVAFLYNVADLGINTCDGAGFELCNFQQAAIGIPQVVSHVGGLQDFFNESNTIVIKPKLTYYIDASRDSVGGEAEMCSSVDFADAILRYYHDPALMARHGKAAREKITSEYSWEMIADRLVNIIHRTLDGTFAYEPLKETIYSVEENQRRAEDWAQRKRQAAAPSPSPSANTVQKSEESEVENDKCEHHSKQEKDDGDMVPL
jgi:glycosyltransferase involved in cell wall biosynthesis